MTDEPLEPEPEEAVDGLPVLADIRAIEPAQPTALPVVQAAVAAATGFVAGAATLAVVQRHRVRQLERRQRGLSGLPGMPVQRRRTFLVDVYLLGRPPGS
jgi:hypothetical protein